MATGAEPGGEQAVAAGCTCKPGQSGDRYYEVENDCPLHGLGMLQAMFRRGTRSPGTQEQAAGLRSASRRTTTGIAEVGRYAVGRQDDASRHARRVAVPLHCGSTLRLHGSAAFLRERIERLVAGTVDTQRFALAGLAVLDVDLPRLIAVVAAWGGRISERPRVDDPPNGHAVER